MEAKRAPKIIKHRSQEASKQVLEQAPKMTLKLMEIQALRSFKNELQLQRELDFDICNCSPNNVEHGPKMAAKTEPTSIKSRV